MSNLLILGVLALVVVACQAKSIEENKVEGLVKLPPLRPGDTFCTREYLPVCGSDGKTYHNLCEFKRATKTRGVDVTYKDGACDEKP